MNDSCHFAVALYINIFINYINFFYSALTAGINMANFPGFVCGLLWAVKLYFNVMFLLLKLSTRLWDLYYNLIITVFFHIKAITSNLQNKLIS